MNKRPKALPATQTAVGQVVAIPYGGAVEVAHLDLQLHRRNAWTRRCSACGERYPCYTRRQALACLRGDAA